MGCCLQNLAIWLSTGANYESPEAIHSAFLESLPEEHSALIPPEFYPLGIQFCKWMWEKRPRHTRRELAVQSYLHILYSAVCELKNIEYCVHRVHYQHQIGAGRS